MAEMKARLDDMETRKASDSDAGYGAPVSPVARNAPPVEASAALAKAKTIPAARLSITQTRRLPDRNTIGDEMTGVARPDTAAPPNDPELKGFIAIPGTDSMIRIGGFAKINAMYDFSPAGNSDKLVTATIPTDGARGRNANLDANATRFSFEVRRPSSLGPLRFYLENDFYGGSGVTAFRLRQAHGQVGNLYGGYGYSAFTDSDAFPETLDDEGPGGEALLRVAALRKIWKVGKGLTATISIEDPSSDISLPDGATTEQPMPDIVGALRIERAWGHVQASFVGRSIGYRLGRDDQSKTAMGFSLAGLGKVGRDFVMASFTYGNGIARHFNDLGGRGYDAVVAPDGQVHTLKAYGGYAGYTRHWDTRWRSSLIGGGVVLERDDLLPSTAFRSSTYGAANLIFQASPSFSFGLETLYGRHELQNRQSGDVVRLQTSLKYDFVR
ncbi:MAG: porin [Novosphingobium sp.]|nr:porin [Novosphingobium sp.]